MRAHAPSRRALNGWWPLIILAALLLLLALAPAVSQQTGGGDEIELFNTGSILYQRNCTSCHGTRAKGDGQVARLLTVKPTDLTQLAKNNGGEFPAEEVQKAIDGRKDVLGHGMRDMPIWGDVFLAEDGSPEAEADAARKVRSLVVYLKKIQEK
jgi:mono/diheme cytochrome c family protein